jgi:two-component system, OmpR family, response regulator
MFNRKRPTRRERQRSDDGESSRTSARSRSRSARFLLKTFIVEDSALILKNLVDTLEELSPVQVVGSAVDEASAVAWLSTPGNDCELLIIDVFLKAGTGLGVLRSAQSLGLSSKRVVLTNYATKDMRAACHALGADRVFDKSSEIEELLDYCDGLETKAVE